MDEKIKIPTMDEAEKIYPPWTKKNKNTDHGRGGENIPTMDEKNKNTDHGRGGENIPTMDEKNKNIDHGRGENADHGRDKNRKSRMAKRPRLFFNIGKGASRSEDSMGDLRRIILRPQ